MAGVVVSRLPRHLLPIDDETDRVDAFEWHDAYAVPCTSCGSPKGRPCWAQGSSAYLPQPHEERVDLMEIQVQIESERGF